jgi:hypothetical protein
MSCACASRGTDVRSALPRAAHSSGERQPLTSTVTSSNYHGAGRRSITSGRGAGSRDLWADPAGVGDRGIAFALWMILALLLIRSATDQRLPTADNITTDRGK